MQQLEEMTVRGATETIPLGDKSIFAASYLGKLSALYHADKFTVARLMKVVVIAETFIIGDSIRGQSNVRHERQLISVGYHRRRDSRGLIAFPFPLTRKRYRRRTTMMTFVVVRDRFIDRYASKNESQFT